MKNTKIKQRKCPLGKAGVCVDYGNCGDCTWCKVIEKYEKKLAQLNAKADKLEVQYSQAMALIDGLEYEQEQIRKETAQELLEDFDRHGVYSKDYTTSQRIYYGIKVKQ